MPILAIETSTLTGSIALAGDDGILGESTLSVSVQHSERLMPAMDHLLREASVHPSAIRLIAVGIGPGSFTGLRIGIAAAQGLGLARDIPVAGVSSLQGLAVNAASFQGLIVPVVNAFRGEVYFGFYRATAEGIPEPVRGDEVLPVKDFAEAIASAGEECLLLGNGLEVCGDLIDRLDAANRPRRAPAPWQHPRAASIAFLASRRTETELAVPVLPRYLRQPG